MQGTSKAGACMHSVGACASCASMQTRDSNVHARCVCRSKVHTTKHKCVRRAKGCLQEGRCWSPNSHPPPPAV